MPGITQVHVDTALTDLSVRRPTIGRFIADQIFPVKRVSKQTDLVWEIDIYNESQRVKDTTRAPGAEANVIDYSNQATLTYYARDHALAHPVPDEIITNADAAIRPLEEAMVMLRESILVEREVNLVTKLGATLTGGQTSSPSNKWDNYTTGDPITDLRTQIAALEVSTGVPRSSIWIALDSRVLDTVANHPDFLDRAKYTMGPQAVGSGQASILAAILNIGGVDVATAAIKNTAGYNATASNSAIWSDNVLIYTKDQIRLGTFALGAHMVWPGLLPGNGAAAQEGGAFLVKRWYDDKRTAEWVQVHSYYDQMVLNSLGGYWFTNVASGY